MGRGKPGDRIPIAPGSALGSGQDTERLRALLTRRSVNEITTLDEKTGLLGEHLPLTHPGRFMVSASVVEQGRIVTRASLFETSEEAALQVARLLLLPWYLLDVMDIVTEDALRPGVELTAISRPTGEQPAQDGIDALRERLAQMTPPYAFMQYFEEGCLVVSISGGQVDADIRWSHFLGNGGHGRWLAGASLVGVFSPTVVDPARSLDVHVEVSLGDRIFPVRLSASRFELDRIEPGGSV